MVATLTAEELAGPEGFDVPADGVVTVDVLFPRGSQVPPPGVWFEGLPASPELAAADARRDPGFWLGRILAFEPTALETRSSEEVLLDGEAAGLWAVVQSRAPQDPSLPRVAFARPVEGHDLCWAGSGYGFSWGSGRTVRSSTWPF